MVSLQRRNIFSFGCHYHAWRTHSHITSYSIWKANYLHSYCKSRRAIGNLSKIERLGIGKAIDSKTMNQTILIDALNELIYDNSFEANVSKLMKISNKLDGIQNVKDIVLSYV